MKLSKRNKNIIKKINELIGLALPIIGIIIGHPFIATIAAWIIMILTDTFILSLKDNLDMKYKKYTGYIELYQLAIIIIFIVI